MSRPTLLMLTVAALLPAAVNAQTLLERLEWPGYGLEENAVSSECAIDETGQVATHHRIGSDLTQHRVEQSQMNLAVLRAAIREAQKGTIRTEQLPVDVETKIYRAYRRLADGSYERVLLWESNGGSGQKNINESRAATKLRNFIDVACDGRVRG